MTQHRVTSHANTIKFPDDEDFEDYETVETVAGWVDYYAPIASPLEWQEILPALHAHLQHHLPGVTVEIQGNNRWRVRQMDE